MIVKRTRGNQVSIPKRVLEEAGLDDEDRYFDVEHRNGIIYLKPVAVEEKISPHAYEELLRWAQKSHPGDRSFRSGREAVASLRKLASRARP